MGIDELTLPKNMIPNEDATSFAEAERILKGETDGSIENLLILLQKSFCHDLWQRLYSKGFNDDPFGLPAYRLFFFINSFRIYLDKPQFTYVKGKVNPVERVVLGYVYKRLYDHYRESNFNPYDFGGISYDGEFLTNFDIYMKKEWEEVIAKIDNKVLSDELRGIIGATNEILMISKKKIDGLSERGISKTLFINYAGMLEIIYAALMLHKNSKYKYASKNLNDLICDAMNLTNNMTDELSELFILSSYINHLRNLIHAGNVTLKNNDLGYNFSVATPLYGFVRSISRDLLS